MEKIWITGVSGHVGTAIFRMLDKLEYEIFDTDKKEVDVTDFNEVQSFVSVNRPDVIINCAGFTDVDECEKNPDMAFKVNAIGAKNLAIAAQETEAKLIQLSTDDVFDLKSDRPYNEFDTPHPKTIYGKSKYAGEKMVKELCSRYTIIRSSWVYGLGKDYVDEVLCNADNSSELQVPNNRFASPTSAFELAKIILTFIDNDYFGVYHAVCKGFCSRYDFAKEILKCAGKENSVKLTAIGEDEKAAYSVLDNMMLRIENLEEPKEWKTALQEYITKTGGEE